MSGFLTRTRLIKSLKRSRVVDSGSNVTFTGVEGIAADEKQWISLHYTVNNATAGDAHVYVNGKKYCVKDLNTRAGKHATVPIAVNLLPGPDNTITFAAEGLGKSLCYVHTCVCVYLLLNRRAFALGFEAHLDGIEVFDGTEEEVEVKL